MSDLAILAELNRGRVCISMIQNPNCFAWSVPVQMPVVIGDNVSVSTEKPNTNVITRRYAPWAPKTVYADTRIETEAIRAILDLPELPTARTKRYERDAKHPD